MDATQLCQVMCEEMNVYEETTDTCVLESLCRHTELLYRHLLTLPQTPDIILTTVAEAIAGIRRVLDDADTSQFIRESARNVDQSRMAGSRRFNIAQDQLEYLLDLRFTCSDIARLLGVSLRTIRRRMEEFGLLVRNRYSSMSDSELDEEVASIKHDYPNAGIILTTGVCVCVCVCVYVCVHVCVYFCQYVYLSMCTFCVLYEVSELIYMYWEVPMLTFL